MRVPFARFATKLKAISGLRNTSFVAYFSRTMSSSVQSIVGEDRSLVAVCQMTSTSDVESNVDTCTQLVRTAKDRGAKVIVRDWLLWLGRREMIKRFGVQILHILFYIK